MSNEVDSFLMGTGGRSAAFKTVDDRVWGEIVHSELRQQTEFGSGELLFWDDGKPRMQLVITLQTDQHEDEDDDGIRKVYAKGEMLKAIRAAVAKANAPGLREGGQLLVQYVKDGPPVKKGFNGPKMFFAKYAPPVEYVAIPDDGDDPDAPF
jgi:hypothetical protein